MVGKAEIEEFINNPQMLAKRVKKYQVYVGFGDIDRNHPGPKTLDPAMAKAILKVNEDGLHEAIQTHRIRLILAKDSFHKGALESSVACLDEANAFIHGLAIIIEKRQDKILSIRQYQQLHDEFCLTILQLNKHGLTMGMAEASLRRGHRMQHITRWPKWINQLLTCSPPTN